MRVLRALVLVHEDLVPPDDPPSAGLETAEWKMEYDVISTLRELGHEVRPLGVRRDLGVIRGAVDEWKPQIAVNLLEEFDGVAVYDQNVVSYLELLRVPYTGCNPRGLMLSRDKALSKKVLAYHRVSSPDFGVFPIGRKVKRRPSLQFPLIVKSLSEDASLGISQASVVDSDDKLAERVAFIQDSVGTAAIAEQFIEGRELYVGVIGNRRLQVFPVWELRMDRLAEEAKAIATERVKWSRKYQKKYRITWGAARLAPEVASRVQAMAKRVYRILGLSGYARIDFRLDTAERIWVLEANPNPDIGYGAELPESAEKAGVSYEALLQRIVGLGLRWRHDLHL